jgi:hypothetical protein
MASMPSFTLLTEISTPPDGFWAGMSMAAVNAELSPLVHMTAPAQWQQCPLSQWATGGVLFRSTILLFGLLPVDVHSLRLEAVYSGQRGFLERSSSWCNKQWQHERTTTPTRGGCVVQDTLTVQGRIPGMALVLMPIYKLVFRHRHRRLKALYGEAGIAR